MQKKINQLKSKQDNKVIKSNSHNASSVSMLGDSLQKKQVSTIENSSYIVQQKKKIDNIFGSPIQCKSNSNTESAIYNKPIQRQENTTGMPDNLKSGVEQLSGIDMSDVKVHYNSDKPSTVQAHAYTQGSNIHVAPGQEKHLAHEAWHVAQQKQGRVQPTTSVNGMAVNDNTSLEKEADVMGAKANAK